MSVFRAAQAGAGGKPYVSRGAVELKGTIVSSTTIEPQTKSITITVPEEYKDGSCVLYSYNASGGLWTYPIGKLNWIKVAGTTTTYIEDRALSLELNGNSGSVTIEFNFTLSFSTTGTFPLNGYLTSVPVLSHDTTSLASDSASVTDPSLEPHQLMILISRSPSGSPAANLSPVGDLSGALGTAWNRFSFYSDLFTNYNVVSTESYGYKTILTEDA